MRLIGLLLFAIGLALSFLPGEILPRLVGREIARAIVFDNGAFTPFEIELDPELTPLEFDAVMVEGGQYAPRLDQAAFTLIVNSATGTAFTAAIAFAERDRVSTADGTTQYTRSIGRLSELAGDTYIFEFGPGDADAIDLKRIDLVLRANAFDLNAEDLAFYGNIAMWVGAVAFFIGLRRAGRRRE
ncbi:MAG: hypothetical protein HC779_07680 [Phyllobacteriaceae bacterium]|nr:hypothetical protein [Phyllobacteriaceae bacterium]